MDEWDELSISELRGLLKRLYERLEQYEIHAGSLSEGSDAREGARTLADRMHNRVTYLTAVLHHRLEAATGPGARTPAIRTKPPADIHAGRSGSGRAA
jgi:hypothetical protein